MNDPDVFQASIRKLEQLAEIDDNDRRSIRALPFTMETTRSGDYLVREQDSERFCRILLSGYACRQKTNRDGGRQIVSFHIPGDILDLENLLFAVADHNLQTITNVTCAVIPSDAMRKVADARPAIAKALWRDTLIDASVFREWVLNVGRRDAKSRIAHMLCEFAARREIAGLGSPEGFALPMTQAHIADATGLTPVHVNRMLAALSEEGVISRERRRVEITDWAKMRTLAGFDPIYLHAAAA